ncbi:ATP-binding protein [Chloroflexota bacterium]
MALRADKQAERDLHGLAVVAKSLTFHLELPELLETVMDKIDEILDPAEFGLILLWDPSEGLFHPKASCGVGIKDPESLYAVKLKEDEAITGIVYNEDKALLWSTSDEVIKAQRNMTPNNRALMERAFDSLAPKSILAAPLSVGENKYGVLILGTLTGDINFSSGDLPFIQTLADLIALAIDRSRLESKQTAITVVEQADRLRAETLATLSHELRTPLAAIKGYATAMMLEDVEWPEEKRKDFLVQIDQECDHLQMMIGDILDSSLIDVGQMSLEFQPVRIQHLAREIADGLQRRTEIHQLVVDFPSDFPIVEVDDFRIKQVIRNIVDNSIKYSPDGGLIVIRGEERMEDVVVSISDQGVGISQEDLIPLFEKYFRVKSPTGFYVPGTGLGLPVARTIVERHRGRIWAESEIGKGTTLNFSLPKLVSS